MPGQASPKNPNFDFHPMDSEAKQRHPLQTGISSYAASLRCDFPAVVSPFGTGGQRQPLRVSSWGLWPWAGIMGRDRWSQQPQPRAGKALGSEAVTQGHGALFSSPSMALVTGKEQHPLLL